MKVKLTKVTNAKRDKLIELAQRYEKRQKKVEAFRAKHEKIFDRLAELEEEATEVHVTLKDKARAEAQTGRTVHLVNLPGVTVEVAGPQGARKFDLEAAKSVWNPRILKKVTVKSVDASLVEELIANGEFTDKDADKAQLPREKKTPRVTIRIRS